MMLTMTPALGLNRQQRRILDRVIEVGTLMGAAYDLNVHPQVVKRALQELRAETGLTTYQLIYAYAKEVQP